MEHHHLLIEPFLDYLKFEKRYSRHTIISYQADLISFFDFVVSQYGETPLNSISHTFIRTWLASIKDEGVTSKTINRKISSLKSFFKYQVKIGEVKQTPMAKVVSPKNEKRLPNFVTEKDIDFLFKHKEFDDTWQEQTKRMLLLLFYQTGVRLSEAINLKESGINFSNSTIKVLGKGNKERVIPIQSGLKKELCSYIERKKNEFKTAIADKLFITEKGKELSPRTVYNWVKANLTDVTKIEKRSPHVLRHTFATHLMNNGAELNAVKELLGHSSLAATQVYTHNTIDKLKNIYKKAHPKA
jgi:integrase/recombinase XerC